MSPRQVVVVDVETNGLDPKRHEAWEVAWHNLATDEHGHFFARLFMPRFLANAELEALRINRFVDRYPGQLAKVEDVLDLKLETRLHEQLSGNTLAGSNPSFDAAMLAKLFEPNAERGASPTPWHHRMWDLSAYAAGVLALDELPGLAKVCELLGVAQPDHTAQGDVTATVACFRSLAERTR